MNSFPPDPILEFGITEFIYNMNLLDILLNLFSIIFFPKKKNTVEEVDSSSTVSPYSHAHTKASPINDKIIDAKNAKPIFQHLTNVIQDT